MRRLFSALALSVAALGSLANPVRADAPAL